MNTKHSIPIFPGSFIPLPNVPFHLQLLFVGVCYITAYFVRSYIEDKREVF